MNDRSSREISIFLTAIDKETAQELDAYLDEACGDDKALRDHILDLVATHRRGHSFLDRPVPELAQTMDLSRDALEEGRSPASGANVVIGDTGHSVLKSLGAKLPTVPRVVLRESPDEHGAVEQPRSKEIPSHFAEGRYQLHGEIARGGMGAIIKGRDADLGRDLAIKVLLESHSEKPEVIERFLEEAQIGGQLQHPGIVPVYELGQFSDERPFFSMKLVKGKTLAKLLSERKDPSDEQAKLLGIFEQACQTMAYAHSRGVIHRDLKPANIMVGAFGEVQVMDWGLAKVLQEGGVADEKKLLDKHKDVSSIRTRRSTGSDTAELGSNTRMGSVMGTPAYMPPEQALGEVDRLDERADVFGLGAILCEILTNKPPYVAEDATQVLRAASRGKLDECFRRLDESEVDQELIDLAKQALAAEPEERLRNAGVIAEDVTKYLTGVQERLKQSELAKVEAQTRAEEESRRRKLHFSIAALMLMIAVGAALTAGFFREQREFQAKLAEVNKGLADDNAKKRSESELARTRLEEQLRVATVMRLSAQAQAIRDESPVQSVLLAIEAARHRDDAGVMPVAHSTLLTTTARVGGRPLVGHEARIWSVAISPDNRWAATGSGDNTARIWDLSTDGRAASVLRGHDAPVNSVAFSPDGRWLATGSNDKTARLWDLHQDPPASTFVLPDHERTVQFVAFSPDGRWVATGSGENAVRLWDLNADNPAASPLMFPANRGHWSAESSFGFSSDSRWLITGAGRSVRIWDIKSDNPEESLRELNGHERAVTCVAISDDGRWIVSGSLDRTARVWDWTATDPASSVIILRGHENWIDTVAISPDSRWLVTGVHGGRARVWDRTADELESPGLLLGPAEVTNFVISQDSRWIVTGGWGSAQVWDLMADEPTASPLVLRGHHDMVESLAIAPNGRWIVTGSWDNTARLWSWDSGAGNPSSSRVLRGSEVTAPPFELSSDGRWLVSGASDDSIRLMDLNGDDPVANSTVLRGHEGPVVALEISPDCRWLAAGSMDSTARLWDLAAPLPEQSPMVLAGHQDTVVRLAFSSDSRWLATGSSEKSQLWDLANPTASPRVLPSDRKNLMSLEISSNSRWLVTGRQAGLARLWDLGDPTAPPRVLSGYHGGAWDSSPLAMSPDGRWIATALSGSRQWETTSVSLWDLDKQDQSTFPISLSGLTGGTSQLAFSNDSRWLVAGCWDGARVWNLSVEDPAASSIKLGGHSSLVYRVAISPDGRWLLTGSWNDNMARLWGLSASDLAASSIPLPGHTGALMCVAISPDNRWRSRVERTTPRGSGTWLRRIRLQHRSCCVATKRPSYPLRLHPTVVG